MATKEITITLSPIVLNVREDMTQEEINDMLDRHYPSGTLNPRWASWGYSGLDEWRNSGE